MADDLGWMDLGIQGNPLVDTPNLDDLAKKGMRFTDAYAAAPICTITNHAPGHAPGFAAEGRNVAEAKNLTYLPPDRKPHD
jgi:hypothetical protein